MSRRGSQQIGFYIINSLEYKAHGNASPLEESDSAFRSFLFQSVRKMGYHNNRMMGA